MEGKMATLAHKGETFLWAVRRRGIAAPGTRLAGQVGVHLDRHAAREKRLVREEAVQFGKSPRGGMVVGFALLLRSLFAPLSFRPLANVRQVFQADKTVWVRLYDASA